MLFISTLYLQIFVFLYCIFLYLCDAAYVFFAIFLPENFLGFCGDFLAEIFVEGAEEGSLEI